MSNIDQTTPLLPRHVRGNRFPNSAFLWRAGAIMVCMTAAVGIAAGAFGAHGLKRRPGITPESIQNWATASHYFVFNGLAVLAVSLHPRFSTHRFAAPAIMAGSLLFSGSIVGLVLARERLRFLGPVTPLGGLLMISGYVALAL